MLPGWMPGALAPSAPPLHATGLSNLAYLRNAASIVLKLLIVTFCAM